MGVAVRREAGAAGAGLGIDPVALGALPVGGADDPARGGEPAVVVGEVDEARGGVGPCAADDEAVGGRVGLVARALRGGDETRKG